MSSSISISGSGSGSISSSSSGSDSESESDSITLSSSSQEGWTEADQAILEASDRKANEMIRLWKRERGTTTATTAKESCWMRSKKFLWGKALLCRAWMRSRREARRWIAMRAKRNTFDVYDKPVSTQGTQETTLLTTTTPVQAPK